MAFRAFLFSADGTATSELCQILTDLEIEAEVCSEMLVAVERITGQPFDALIVDWDLHTEAMFLIKSVRDLKSAAHLLTLAMVKDEAALPEALQAGANSAIRKPIDAKQAHDTLSTAKQLIQAQHTEKRSKEERLASVQDSTEESDASSVDQYGPAPEAEDSRPKSGFLQQTATRSAFEAEASKPEPAEEEPPAPPPAPDADARARALRILGYGPQVPDAPKPEASRPSPRIIDFNGRLPGTPRDSGGVFSSLPDPSETEDSETVPARRPRYGLFAAVAALLVAAGLWMYAPKAKFVAGVRSFAQRLAHSAKVATASNSDNTPVPDLAPEPISGKPTVSVTPDPEIVDAEDDAAAKVQVIENKPIPTPGAQQPPADASQPDLSAGQSPVASQSAEAAQALSPPQSQVLIQAPSANSALQPTIQSVSVQPSATAGSPSTDPAVTQPAVAPASTAPAATSHVPEEGFSANLAPHSAVIIPDSLKTSPAPAPASNLENPTVPEEVSRTFVIKRVEPQYPPAAVQQRLDGMVVLQVHVAKDGSIRDLKLVKGYFVLGRAAFEAVKLWRFRPYTINGKATEFQTYVTVSFRLPG